MTQNDDLQLSTPEEIYELAKKKQGGGKRKVAKKSSAKKSSAKKSSAKKSSVKKSSAKKTAKKQSGGAKKTAKKTSNKKTSVKKTSNKKTSAKKTSTKKTSAKKTSTKKRSMKRVMSPAQEDYQKLMKAINTRLGKGGQIAFKVASAYKEKAGGDLAKALTLVTKDSDSVFNKHKAEGEAAIKAKSAK